MLHNRRRYGRLRILSHARSLHRHARFNCRCKCGTQVTVRACDLISGHSTSCGCWQAELLRKRSTKHGEANSVEYRLHRGILRRCYERKNKSYRWYGKRGIGVCRRWRKFENFLRDMGRRPHPKLTIERLNNDKGYGPANCAWRSRAVQARNTRRSIKNRRAA
jgi:hypothetical protein